MKNYLFFLFLISSALLTTAQMKAKIGISISDFKKLYPDTKSAVYQNSVTFSLQDTIYKIDGEWGFRFENNKLDWIHYSRYYKDINETAFKKCLSAASSLIKDYSVFYGNPDELITGDTTFTDPYKKRHWGYDVIEARWKNVDGMKIKIEFTFMGGKGEYCFLFKINYFSKDYPYYD